MEMLETIKRLAKKNIIVSKLLGLQSKNSFKNIFRKAGFKKNIETIFDVGANIGLITLEFLNFFPKAKVWAFEPSNENFKSLERIASRHKERVKLFKLGLYSETCIKKLRITTSHFTHSLLPLHEDFKKSHNHIQEIKNEEISVIKLDDFVNEHNLQKIDLLKIDVEGVEYEVLKGGIDTLSNRTDSLMLEISLIRKGRRSNNLIKVLDLLYDCGFYLRNIYEFQKKVFGPLEYLNEMDCIFKK